MKLNKDGSVTIELYDLLENMEDDAKLQLLSHLACQDVVIKMVYDQIMNGCTDDGWSGYSCGILPDAGKGTILDTIQRNVAKDSSERAKLEIELLESKLSREVEHAKEYSDKYWSLYHWCNDNKIQGIPRY